MLILSRQVLEFRIRKEMTLEMWTERQEKIQTFFGPGVQADIQKTEEVSTALAVQCPVCLMTSSLVVNLFPSLWCTISAFSNLVLFSSVLCTFTVEADNQEFTAGSSECHLNCLKEIHTAICADEQQCRSFSDIQVAAPSFLVQFKEFCWLSASVQEILVTVKKTALDAESKASNRGNKRISLQSKQSGKDKTHRFFTSSGEGQGVIWQILCAGCVVT